MATTETLMGSDREDRNSSIFPKINVGLSIMSLISTIVVLGLVASRTTPINQSTMAATGFMDTSTQIPMLVGQSSNQEIYDLVNATGSHIGIRRRLFDANRNYYDVDFVTGDISNVPYAGQFYGNRRQYTVIRAPNGDTVVLSPENYMDYMREIVNGSGPATHSLHVMYNGVMTTVMAHRDATGALSGVALQPLNTNIQAMFNIIINLMKTAQPITPSPKYRPMVNTMCVIIHCGVAGVIDVATCVVEVGGPQVALGWILCGGQSIMAGCACLNCWGDCNA